MLLLSGTPRPAHHTMTASVFSLVLWASVFLAALTLLDGTLPWLWCCAAVCGFLVRAVVPPRLRRPRKRSRSGGGTRRVAAMARANLRSGEALNLRSGRALRDGGVITAAEYARVIARCTLSDGGHQVRWSPPCPCGICDSCWRAAHNQESPRGGADLIVGVVQGQNSPASALGFPVSAPGMTVQDLCVLCTEAFWWSGGAKCGQLVISTSTRPNVLLRPMDAVLPHALSLQPGAYFVVKCVNYAACDVTLLHVTQNFAASCAPATTRARRLFREKAASPNYGPHEKSVQFNESANSYHSPPAHTPPSEDSNKTTTPLESRPPVAAIGNSSPPLQTPPSEDVNYTATPQQSQPLQVFAKATEGLFGTHFESGHTPRRQANHTSLPPSTAPMSVPASSAIPAPASPAHAASTTSAPLSVHDTPVVFTEKEAKLRGVVLLGSFVRDRSSHGVLTFQCQRCVPHEKEKDNLVRLRSASTETAPSSRNLGTQCITKQEMVAARRCPGIFVAKAVPGRSNAWTMADVCRQVHDPNRCTSQAQFSSIPSVLAYLSDRVRVGMSDQTALLREAREPGNWTKYASKVHSADELAAFCAARLTNDSLANWARRRGKEKAANVRSTGLNIDIPPGMADDAMDLAYWVSSHRNALHPQPQEPSGSDSAKGKDPTVPKDEFALLHYAFEKSAKGKDKFVVMLAPADLADHPRHSRAVALGGLCVRHRRRAHGVLRGADGCYRRLRVHTQGGTDLPGRRRQGPASRRGSPQR
jgi:hypothetical protein